MTIGYRGGSEDNDGLTAGTDTIALSKPAGSTVGDLALVGIVSSSTGLTMLTEPSGWSQIPNSPFTQGSALMLWVYYKLLTLGDALSNTYSWVMSSSNRPAGVMDVLTGVDQTTPIEDSQITGAGSNTSQSAPAVTSDTDLDWIVNYWAARAGSGGPFVITPPGTHTTRQGAATAFAAGAVNTAIKSATLTTPGAAGTYGPYSAGYAGAANGGMASLALKPAAAAAAVGSFFPFVV